MSLTFHIHATDHAARTGILSTKHGEIRTPAFMPVGTAATVKAMTPEAVRATGADIILGNTYHLMLRPTAERIARLGGLHHFMQWQRPILTDSGGFQVMSLAQLRSLSEEGVTFQSPYDGGVKHVLTPERSMEIQYLLGSDITMAFDECTPYPADESTAKQSMELSMRWAERSKNSYIPREGYGLFGIVQGSIYQHLREYSAHTLKQIGFDGYAIGGLAVGEGQAHMFRTLEYTVPQLPIEKPRYLMGVGKPPDIIGAVLRGVDMFDCVLPTRSGRNGQAFTAQGAFSMRNARFAEDQSPIEAHCECYTCTQYSRAYLHHLFKSEEMLGATLLTWHNLQFYQNLMQHLRSAITEKRLHVFADKFLAHYQNNDSAEAEVG